MASSSQPQQRGQQRGPAFAQWPTVKIFMPPQGRFSPKTDEWCFTYCTQSVTGRIHASPPSCSTVCIRKVFPHEVRNVLSFKRHANVPSVDKDGKPTEGRALYPLPAEGQTENVPRLFGGDKGKKPAEADDDSGSAALNVSKPETRYWDTGLYFFSTSTIVGTLDHYFSMHQDLKKLAGKQKHRENLRKQWLEYQDWLERQGGMEGVERMEEEIFNGIEGKVDPSKLDADSRKYWGHRHPRQPPPDTVSSSLLVPLPPSPPSPLVSDKLASLLAPSKRALELLASDVSDGTYTRFVERVWEKAGTDQPYLLARRSWEKLVEAWKSSKDGDDKQKE